MTLNSVLLTLLFLATVNLSICDRFELSENEYGIPKKFHAHAHHHHHQHKDQQHGPSSVSPVLLNSANQEIITNPITPPPLIISNMGPAIIPGVIPLRLPGLAPIPVDIGGSENALCPDAPNQRYYNETRKCHTPGNKEDNPCGEYMQFYALPGDDLYGDCDCEPNIGCDYRPLVYSPPAKRCFHLFQQGPCKPGEWLVSGQQQFNPICVKRSCPENTDPNPLKTWFSLKNSCYQLSTRGFCKNANETLHFNKGDVVPKCYDAPVLPPGCGINKSLISGAPSLPCGPGQKKTGSGACGTSVGII